MGVGWPGRCIYRMSYCEKRLEYCAGVETKHTGIRNATTTIRASLFIVTCKLAQAPLTSPSDTFGFG